MPEVSAAVNEDSLSVKGEPLSVKDEPLSVKDVSPVKSAERTVKILETLAASPTRLTLSELQERMGRVLHIHDVGLATLVYPLGNCRGHQRTDSLYWRGQPVDHVPPVRHHIQCDTATL